MTALYLLEPERPRPHWIPFAGVRPVAELRAGVWKIRERWEAALDLETRAILGDHIAHFHEGFEPACQAAGPIDGPAIIAASWFAPTGAPIILGGTTRRLTAGGHPVGWVVPSGQRWTGPDEAGEAQEIDGLTLRGTWDLLLALDRYLANDCLGFGAGPRDPVPTGAIVLGDPNLILTHRARIEPGVVFDTHAGAIVLEAGVEVRHGTRLEGPLYAGPGSRLLGDHIRFSSIGPRCNVKGEVSNAIFTGYSNKGHDGFVGHTVLGHWVNLGAGTTTSNLKNTYGEVQLELDGVRVKTGRQFLGSLIGDHAKTAIGTMLPTGTVIGAGASVFGNGSVPKEVRPFAWGIEGSERLHEEGFLTIAERVMPRREVEFTAARRAALSATWKKLTAG
ncbi:MAG TPA: putative sugar nucleotidyl transferase [Gemmatimonadales bacterium]|nr:putative sugar nucleotidyl transferase [Gemmatimonadales bacterium]